jgi:hypothetical protein
LQGVVSDILVRHRQTKVMASATKTNDIVALLYPSNVGSQLFKKDIKHQPRLDRLANGGAAGQVGAPECISAYALLNQFNNSQMERASLVSMVSNPSKLYNNSLISMTFNEPNLATIVEALWQAFCIHPFPQLLTPSSQNNSVTSMSTPFP